MQPGSVVAGRFRIEELAGTGGMGRVYRAMDLQTSGAVALKIIEGVGRAAQRFTREARVLAQLAHPGIVRYVAHGATADGRGYLAMEWLTGEDLGVHLKRRRPSIEEALLIGRRIAEALGAAHSVGVIHRDLKPGNIFLCGARVSEIKLLDFGVARMVDTGRPLTAAGSVVGTLGYMAPEQARGEPNVGAAADVFSLGCVLFEAIAGRAAFEAETPLGLLAKILVDDAPRLASVAPRAPAVLDELLATLLAKQPEDRPPDGTAALRLLQAIDPRSLAFSPLAHDDADDTPSLTGSERHLVSAILLGGLVADHGKTLLTEERDACLERVQAVAVEHGAESELLGDESALLVFRGAGSATDRLRLAGRCALVLERILPGVPIALATGRSGAAEHPRLGSVLDRAARLVTDGAVDEMPGVQLDELTAGLLALYFHVSGHGERFRLREELPTANEPRRLLGKVIPFVGRSTELRVLASVARRCFDDPCTRTAVVTGGVGAGKSRLVLEVMETLRATVPRLQVWQGRAPTLGATRAHSYLASLLGSCAGITADDAPEVVRLKVRMCVARRVPKEQRARFEGLLTFLLTDGRLPSGPASASPPSGSGSVGESFADFLGFQVLQGPLVLIGEDAHWIDAASMQAMEAALRRFTDLPVFAIYVGHPAFFDAFPSLAADRSIHVLRLGGLTRRAATEMLTATLGPDCTPTTAARILELAEGNPLYLEELIRAHAEGGPDFQVPETLLALSQQQIEAMEPDARRVLQTASLLDGRFGIGALGELLGTDMTSGQLTETVRALLAREVLSTIGAPLTERLESLQFRHPLLQQAAYAMLTDADRNHGHARANAWRARHGLATDCTAPTPSADVSPARETVADGDP